MVTAVALIAFFAPEDADQGVSQKIFYVHVPIALTAYVCFGRGSSTCGSARPGPTSRATSPSTRA